jgi:NitT/TauT family transport system substrate-binding protein
VALILIIAISLTACGTKDNTDSKKDAGSGNSQYKYGKIDIPGKDGALCGAPIYIAYEKGFFAEEGFDVNLISADTA